LALDATRMPTQLADGTNGEKRFRYWLTGFRGDGAISLTFLAGTWSYNSSAATTPTTATVTANTGTITVTLPNAPTDMTLDPASVTNDAFAASIASGWKIVLDTSRAPVLRSGNQWDIPVIVTAPTGSASGASATATVTLQAGGIAYTGKTTGGTQADGSA